MIMIPKLSPEDQLRQLLNKLNNPESTTADPLVLKASVLNSITEVLCTQNNVREEATLAFEAATIESCALRIQATNAPRKLAADIAEARRRERKRVKQTLEHLNNEINAIQTETENSERSREQQAVARDELRQYFAELQSSRLECATNLRATISQRTSLQLDSRNVNNEISKLVQKKAELDHERAEVIEAGAQRAHANSRRIAHMQNQIAEVREQAAAVGVDIPEPVIISKEEQMEIDKENEVKIEAINEAQKEISRLQMESRQLQAAFDLSQKMISDVNESLEEFDPDLVPRLQREISELADGERQAHANLKQQSMQASEYVTTCDKETERIKNEQLDVEKAVLEKAKRKLRRLCIDKEDAKDLAEQAKSVVEGLHNATATAKSELAVMTQEMLEASDACFKMEEQIEEIDNEHEVFMSAKVDRNTTVKIKISEAEKILSEKEAFKDKKIAELQQFVSESLSKEANLKSTTDNYLREGSSMSKANSKLENEVKIIQSEIDLIVTKRHKLQDTDKTLRCEKATYLEGRNKTIGKLKQRLPVAEMEAKAAKEEMELLDQQIFEAKEVLSAAHADVRSQQDQIQPFEDKVESLQRQLGNKKRAALDWDTKLNNAKQDVAAAARIIDDEHAAKQLDMDVAATRLGLSRTINMQLGNAIEALQHKSETMGTAINNLLKVRSILYNGLQQAKEEPQTWQQVEANHRKFTDYLDSKAREQLAKAEIEAMRMSTIRKARTRLNREKHSAQTFMECHMIY